MSACEKMGWGAGGTLYSMLLKLIMCNTIAATAALIQETNNEHTWMLCYSNMNSLVHTATISITDVY
jgi:hypothetical protein